MKYDEVNYAVYSIQIYNSTIMCTVISILKFGSKSKLKEVMLLYKNLTKAEVRLASLAGKQL